MRWTARSIERGTNLTAPTFFYADYEEAIAVFTPGYYIMLFAAKDGTLPFGNKVGFRFRRLFASLYLMPGEDSNYLFGKAAGFRSRITRTSEPAQGFICNQRPPVDGSYPLAHLGDYFTPKRWPAIEHLTAMQGITPQDMMKPKGCV